MTTTEQTDNADEFVPKRKARRQFRSDDKLIDKLGVFFDNYKWIGVLFWSLFGGGVGSLIYRFYLAHDVRAVQADIMVIKAHDAARDSDVMQIKGTLNTLLKGQCFDRTLQEQYFMGIICPHDVYKGSNLIGNK